MNYDKLLLDELRVAAYYKGDYEVTDELLAKAVTMNENLQTLGYSLAPNDIVVIAGSPSLDHFYDGIKNMMDTVDADPMYPGFPEQVMNIDEAVFRFHQLVHYFSTYGMERIFGVEVKKGWMPCENESSSSAKEQKIVLNAKTIKLIPAEEVYITPIQMILSRKERMTLPEREIIEEAISHVSYQQLQSVKIGFKENLNTLYSIIFGLDDRGLAFSILRTICQHTGDVLNCIWILLKKNKFHFRTSQKRFFVKLLESYPVKDFRENLVLSGKNIEQNLVILNYIDYSMYSKSKWHMAAVDDLRDGTLRSWNSTVERMLKDHDDRALDHISKRPGMMLRMIARLLRSGYSNDDIIEKLSENASALSIQTLVTNLNHFGKLTKGDRKDCDELYVAFEYLLKARMKSCQTPFRGKKVMIKMDDYDLGKSEIRCNDKSAEGGYIRSGLAYRIPKGINRLRFFVYWNDEERVDVDLHSTYTDVEGMQRHVGWNSDFRNCGVVHSGDVTHSDAAEYIDIDMTAPIDKVFADIHLYSGWDYFSEVDTCFVGMMGVPDDSTNGTEGELYREANCFFKHNLRQRCSRVNYGYIDVRNRCLIFDGEPDQWTVNRSSMNNRIAGRMNLARYLVYLLNAQEAEVCDNEEDADVVLVMGKPENEKEVSLIDSNFFMES